MAGVGKGFNEFLSSFASCLALISGGRGFKLFTFFSNAEKSPKGFGITFWITESDKTYLLTINYRFEILTFL